MRISLDIAGLDTLNAKLAAIFAQVGAAAEHALRAEGEIEMTEAKLRTPVLTGALRASGHVEGPRDGAVRLVFGGPAAPYALYVHENMEALHKTGQAKFLESVILESAPYLAQRVAARIAQSVK